MRKRVKMGRREMGIEDESGKCGKMPEREREKEAKDGGRTEEEERRQTAGEKESLARRRERDGVVPSEGRKGGCRGGTAERRRDKKARQ